MSTNKKQDKQLWASRFNKTTDPIAKAYTESITVDRPMFYHSVWGSEAHVIMLANNNILTDAQCKKILTGLHQIKQDFATGTWDLGLAQEDVQMNIEKYLIDTIGMENGGRMHTTRSRNDQVPSDTRLYVRDLMFSLLQQLTIFIDILLNQALKHTKTLMPGYTHVQHAQPITYAYWLTNLAAVLLRDTTRLLAAYDNNNLSPLGAGAIAGTSFPTNRKMTADLLGYAAVQEHALDAIGNNDSCLEILSSLSILYTTYSRIANDIIYNTSYEFDMMTLDDSFAMGSSMMPQKKNPGCLERVRGHAGEINGILVHMLTLMKGIHTGYNRDYHDTKETLVRAIPLVTETTELLAGVLDNLTIKPQRMEYLVKQNFATATELANYLVRVHNIPFRETHHIVGNVVRALVTANKTFEDKKTTKELLGKNNIQISDEDYANHLNPNKVIENCKSLGSVAPSEVKRMIEQMLLTNNTNKKHIQTNADLVTHAKEKTAKIIQDIVWNNKSVTAATKLHM